MNPVFLPTKIKRLPCVASKTATEPVNSLLLDPPFPWDHICDKHLLQLLLRCRPFSPPMSMTLQGAPS